MPIRETGVRYEYPVNETHMRDLIEYYRSIGAQWISTAIIVDGRMRMKFARLSHYKEVAPVQIVERAPRSDKGVPRKKRAATIKPSDKIGYAGRLGRERPEWDR